MLYSVLFSVSFLVTAQAMCDNACSGHGTCSFKSICSCYDNWGVGLSHDSGDCSQRICPFEFAWVDTPDKLGKHHKYSECASKGICNRDTAECECFPGYEGKGCQRTTCPNDCSGHGQCAYIKDLPFAAVPFDYANTTSYLSQEPHQFNYYNWDASKTRGCVCDPEYGDVDCSKRMCPYGTDVMDVRQDLTKSGKYQVQSILFKSYLDPRDQNVTLQGQTFALTFKTKLNESFTTIPIVWNSNLNGIHQMAIHTKMALQGLPNRVIDKVDVQAGFLSNYVHLNISFIGEHVQGPQHLLTVRAFECLDGCTPKLTGLELHTKSQDVSEKIASDYNSFECGRRGKCDYSSGICSCFAGYTGVSCNTITALV